MNKTVCSLILAACLMALVGCSPPPAATTATSTAPDVNGSKYLLADEPAEPSDVFQAREQAKDQDDVVIVGRIGGSANPWVDGRAAFSIVDTSLKSCLECGSDGCPKPWDYC